MKIKELREKANLKQEDVARQLNVDRSTVSKWETNEARPHSDKLPQLAKIFGCTIDDLYRKEGE